MISLWERYIVTFAILIVLCTTLAKGRRRIISELNPGCNGCTSETVVVYIQAVGTNDTLHQLWDFTGVPTVLYTVGPLNSTITIGWWDNHPTRFTFSEQPYYSFGIAIDTLYEYNDVGDTGKFDPSSSQKMILLSDLTWQLTDASSIDRASANVRGYFKPSTGKSGAIDLQLNVSSDTTSESLGNADTSISLQMVNLTTSPEYNSSRFALRFILISTDDDNDSWVYTSGNTSRDEQIIEIKSPKEVTANTGGFLDLHTIAYTNPEHTLATKASVSSDLKRSVLPNSGAVKQFYQDYKPASLLLQDAAVSFGTAGDGFYTQRNFTAWSSTLGYGVPSSSVPVSSSFVLLIICVVVCISLVALGTAMYYFMQRYKQRHGRYPFVNLHNAFSP